MGKKNASGPYRLVDGDEVIAELSEQQAADFIGECCKLQARLNPADLIQQAAIAEKVRGGGRASAQGTNDLKRERADALRSAAEAEYLRLRGSASFKAWTWTRLCQYVASRPPIIEAWGGRRPSLRTLQRVLAHLKDK